MDTLLSRGDSGCGGHVGWKTLNRRAPPGARYRELSQVLYRVVSATSLTPPLALFDSFELGEEHVTQSTSGVVKRSTASLIHDGELTGYVVAAVILPPDGRDLSLVDARRLGDGGHLHVQVCWTFTNWFRS